MQALKLHVDWGLTWLKDIHEIFNFLLIRQISPFWYVPDSLSLQKRAQHIDLKSGRPDMDEVFLGQSTNLFQSYKVLFLT